MWCSGKRDGIRYTTDDNGRDKHVFSHSTVEHNRTALESNLIHYEMFSVLGGA